MENIWRDHIKVYYLSYNSLVFCVVYAKSKTAAFHKAQESRKELFKSLCLPMDIGSWNIEEFTPDMYDGVLCFY